MQKRFDHAAWRPESIRFQVSPKAWRNAWDAFPGKDPGTKSNTATNTSQTTRTFCDDETDSVETTLTKAFTGEMDASLIYKHGTKITAKFDKDGKKLTITITFKDQPPITIELPPPP